MACCCVQILNLCDTPVCGSLIIDDANATAPDSGVENNYTLVIDHLQMTITLTELQTEGQPIHFDVSGLNENYQYTGQIFDSNGIKVTINDTFDCIKFKTVVNVLI